MNSIKLDAPIAHGRTADVYAWPDGKILKLFHDWFPREDIQYELDMNKAVHSAGLPVPEVYGMIEFEGKNALIYERVYGRSVWDILRKKPWKFFRFTYMTARLHAEMHSKMVQAEIPSLRQRLEYKIHHANSLSEPLQNACLDTLHRLPEFKSLCHGDFHPLNILISRRGPVIIDWLDASIGNPLADVARTSIILLGAISSSEIQSGFERWIVKHFHSAYLRYYFQLRPGGEEEYRNWLPVVAAARLSENIPELEQWLLYQVRKQYLLP